MSKNKVLQKKFKPSFLLPKYWLTWLGVCVLYTISWLPYKWQLSLGRIIGRTMMKFAGTRVKVAQKNIDVCFPELSTEERADLVKRNFENTGIALLETGIGWWWPNWRLTPMVKIKGIEHIEKARADGSGILLLAMHNLCIEAVARGIGQFHPTVVFYRPNHNQLMEYFQHAGRARSNKFMLEKSDVQGMKEALKTGEICVYLPDQDYGRKRSLFAPFFNVPQTATTIGTLVFAKQKNVKTLMGVPSRLADGSGYEIEFFPVLENFPSGDDVADLTLVNQHIEQSIRRNPDQYMWLHRRFKTRPNPTDPKFYS